MNVKNNKKYQQSFEKIKTAICTLLKEDEQKKLSVTQICQKAQINRTTFYAHFDKTEDAIYAICEEYIVKAYKLFLNEKISYTDRIKQMLGIIENKLDFFRYVFNNVHNLDVKIMDMLEDNLFEQTPYMSDMQSKLSLVFIVSGFVGVGKIYFSDAQNKMTPHQFADVLANAVNVSNPYFEIK